MNKFMGVLKTIGKDLSHVGQWIDAGLKLIEPVVGVIDPPLGAIFTEIETVLSSLQSTTGLTTAQVQGIVTAITTIASLKAGGSAAASTTTSTTTVSK